MVVVAIVSVVAALAARMYSRGTRGETGPAFARSMMSTLLEARNLAVTLGQTVRVTVNPPNTLGQTSMLTESHDTTDTTGTKWVSQALTAVPSTMQLCSLVGGMQLGDSTLTPICPAAGTNILCFYPNGRVDLPTSGVCATTSPVTGTGATVYFDTDTGDHKYKVVVWGLTGMAKLIDQW